MAVNLLYPKIRFALLPAIFGYALFGALLAGVFGIIHDQITFSISPEYFTRLKFQQFHYANFGLPPRFFVAEIGFLATWWVGFFSGWFLSRITVPAMSRPLAFHCNVRGFAVILAAATAGCIVGYILGKVHGSNFSSWENLASMLGVTDVQRFVRVAYIHNASYLGGLIGLIAALLLVKKQSRGNFTDSSSHPE